MITHLQLRNFQSWKKLDLDLGPVTMIVGKGNAGKTAIVRALKYALTNQTGDDFIRDGANSTLVGIATENDFLLWEKKRGKGGTYDLNDTRFTKTAGAVPAEIMSALGIYEVEIDKSTVLMPNIQMQFEMPFIISESGSKIARILGRLTKLNVLVMAQMACRKALDQAHRDHDAGAVFAEHIDATLALFPDLSELEEMCDELDARLESHAAEKDRIGMAAVLVKHRTRRLSDLADAGLEVDRAEEELATLKAEYESLCQEQGVCEGCPWR